MGIAAVLSSVFGFRKIPTTVLAVLLYLAIFISVFLTDRLPDIPRDTHGLNLEQAYADLHIVAARPHPLNSHANDIVRDYLLSRLSGIAESKSYIEIADDVRSNASWAPNSRLGIYYEGNNILLKINGTSPSDPGVLFSAHFDSVSTAPGAVDDGMGVVTLVQLAQYFAEHRPKRTVVFNINNGEEDGLMGAHAFLEHPWSPIPDVFLNLEGASAGGRPLLFRSTSRTPLSAFSHKHVPHPHTNVLSAESFKHGVIRSGTDYSIYERRGMDGLDFAFYRGRSKYHTQEDSVPDVLGGKKALWAMMEGAFGAGVALANEDSTHAQSADDDGGVYFDLFAAYMVVFKRKTLFIANIILLTVGPIVVLLLIFADFTAQRSRAAAAAAAAVARAQEEGEEASLPSTLVPEKSVWQRAWAGFIKFQWLYALWRLAKFWLALAVGIGLQIALVVGYLAVNPFIIYSHPYIVLTSFISLAFLSIVIVLQLPISRQAALPEQQKLVVLLQNYMLSWVFLVISTVAVNEWKLGSVYLITAWNGVASLGAVLGLLEAIAGAEGTQTIHPEVSVSNHHHHHHHHHHHGEYEEGEGREEHEQEVNERTPLVRHSRESSPVHAKDSNGSKKRKDGEEEAGAIGWWIIQMLVVLPVPVILVLHLTLIMLESLSQTLVDGSSAVLVYTVISVLAFLIILPLAPFSIKISRVLIFLVLLVFALSTTYNMLQFPFSKDEPFKFYFQQRVELANVSAPTDIATPITAMSAPSVVQYTTTLNGAEAFLEKYIVSQLPTASWNTPNDDGNKVECGQRGARQGLTQCSWHANLRPEPGNSSLVGTIPFDDDVSAVSPSPPGAPPSRHPTPDYIRLATERINASWARISVGGTNTRSCKLHFDSPEKDGGADKQRVRAFYVHGSGDPARGLQAGWKNSYSEDEGLEEIRLWSRTWDRTFVVDVLLDSAVHNSDLSSSENDSAVYGRASCGWNEFKRATAGGGGASGGSIPALEEVFDFAPRWALVTKNADALVEAWTTFQV